MVCSAQGTPRPTRMSNTLLPIVLDTAMSPRPAAKNGRKLWVEASRSQASAPASRILFFTQKINKRIFQFAISTRAKTLFGCVEPINSSALFSPGPGPCNSHPTFYWVLVNENVNFLNTASESFELKPSTTVKGTGLYTVLFEKLGTFNPLHTL